MAKIAFLGAGTMGSAMVPHLLKAGHDVTVYNRTLKKARPLEAQGGVVVDHDRHDDIHAAGRLGRRRRDAAADAFSVGQTGSGHVKRHAQYVASGVHENPIHFPGATG
jgi:nucleoside-diphosphate-sugar epimerase